MEKVNKNIQYIYAEGEIDITFFGQILNFVSVDEEDNLVNKNAKERINDAIKLTKYLLSTGDFRVGRTQRGADGKFLYLPFEHGFSEFKSLVMHQFSDSGIDDVELHYTTWIQKILPGKPPSATPIEISRLFAR